jgi:AcrR family transcriptional regulator
VSTPTSHARPYGGVEAAERVARRRAKLIDAGLLFGTQGFAATGVKDVCRAAGLTDRYFYESFANREALLVAVFDAIGEELLAGTATAVAAAPEEPAVKARVVIEQFVEALATDPRKARVLFVEAMSVADVVVEHARARMREFALLMAETARTYLPGYSDDELVMGALSMVGVVEQTVIGWQRREFDLPVERLVDHCVTVFLAVGRAYGLRPAGVSNHPAPI